MLSRGAWAAAFAIAARALRRLTEQHVLLPLLGAVLLVTLWGATANLILVGRQLFDGANPQAVCCIDRDAVDKSVNVLFTR